MNLYNVYYDQPMVVQIQAETEEDARELFMSGEFDGEVVDKDGTIDEPKLIMLFDEDEDGGCRTIGCDGDPDDGEGYNGFCGNCADRLDEKAQPETSTMDENQQRFIAFADHPEAAKFWQQAEDNCDTYEGNGPVIHNQSGPSLNVLLYRQQNDVEGGWSTMCMFGHDSAANQSHCSVCGIHKPQGMESDDSELEDA